MQERNEWTNEKRKLAGKYGMEVCVWSFSTSYICRFTKNNRVQQNEDVFECEEQEKEEEVVGTRKRRWNINLIETLTENIRDKKYNVWYFSLFFSLLFFCSLHFILKVWFFFLLSLFFHISLSFGFSFLLLCLFRMYVTYVIPHYLVQKITLTVFYYFFSFAVSVCLFLLFHICHRIAYNTSSMCSQFSWSK